MIPRQLPAPPCHWADRNKILTALPQHADRGGPAVVVVSGLGGVGKTALAVQRVHTLRNRFANGQLDADLSEVDAAGVLVCWLRARGHIRLPHRSAELPPTWLSVTSARALAMVIDDADTAPQVAPPLPADTEWLIRAYATEGNSELDVVTAEILAVTSGGLRIQAVRTAGQLALPAPANTGTHHNRSQTTPNEVTDMSYETLPALAKRLYRRLGDHPSRYFTTAAADAMLDTTTRATTELALEILLASGMVVDHHTCYSMPHTIQEHARTLADQDDQHTRKAARARVITLAYLPAAVDADYVLNPHPPRYNPVYEELRSGARTSRFGHPREAMTWFTTHLGTLRGLLHQAHEHDDHIAVCDLAEASWGAILKGRLNRYLVDSHELAVASARECGSPAESILTTRLSWGYRRTDRLSEAINAAVTARQVAVKAGDDWAESTAWSAEGRAYQAKAEYNVAVERFLESLAIAERLGDSRSIALRLRYIAECHTAQQRYAEACECLENAAARMDTIGDTVGYAGVLVKLAAPRIANGQADLALDDMVIALEIMRDSGSDAYVADVLACTGDAAAALGHTTDARQHYTQAHDLFAAVDDTTNADRMTAALAAL
ncbi:hypothetical protein [Saccharopolyspora spinosa]|uniref:hypothetical protein n=1 Tax=Saccharopolyspora spinosa TaxID=60894 RepID=UPI000237B3DB|nr:hypothetical protein [Saccharopolyspora spinosa]